MQVEWYNDIPKQNFETRSGNRRFFEISSIGPNHRLILPTLFPDVQTILRLIAYGYCSIYMPTSINYELWFRVGFEQNFQSD